MRALYISLVVALGLAAGMFWTRDTATVRGPRTAPMPDRIAPVPRDARNRPSITARSPALHPTPPIKTLEPTSTDPEARAHQETLWRQLQDFAETGKLSDAQWEQFRRDLSELAATESAALAKGVRTGLDGFVDLADELDTELLDRCAAYMTKDQIAELRFRFLDLVGRARRLHYAQAGLDGEWLTSSE